MLLRRGVDSRAFPGASVCVAAKDGLLGSGAVGRFEYSSQSPEGTSATSFDLASLTKVMATTTAAMLLFERGKMRLDEPVVNVVPEFRGEDHRREAVTYRMLLAHSSGLPGHRRFFETTRDRESLLNLIYATPLEATPGSRVEY